MIILRGTLGVGQFGPHFYELGISPVEPIILSSWQKADHEQDGHTCEVHSVAAQVKAPRGDDDFFINRSRHCAVTMVGRPHWNR